jgi:hypothetical protein
VSKLGNKIGKEVRGPILQRRASPLLRSPTLPDKKPEPEISLFLSLSLGPSGLEGWRGGRDGSS